MFSGVDFQACLSLHQTSYMFPSDVPQVIDPMVFKSKLRRTSTLTELQVDLSQCSIHISSTGSYLSPFVSALLGYKSFDHNL